MWRANHSLHVTVIEVIRVFKRNQQQNVFVPWLARPPVLAFIYSHFGYWPRPVHIKHMGQVFKAIHRKFWKKKQTNKQTNKKTLTFVSRWWKTDNRNNIYYSVVINFSAEFPGLIVSAFTHTHVLQQIIVSIHVHGVCFKKWATQVIFKTAFHCLSQSILVSRAYLC